MRIFATVAALALLGVSAQGAIAEDLAGGHFQARLRLVTVNPDPAADIVVSGVHIGGKTKVSTSLIPEADLTYFFNDHIAVEAIAGITKHTVTNSVAGRVSSVWLLPPTVTAQYHFDPAGPVRPYVGAGLNYTFFYSPSSALPNIGFKNSFGWALQAGVDVPIGEGPYFLNLDVKKIFLNTRIKASGGVVSAKASLDPWLLGAGIGIRF